MFYRRKIILALLQVFDGELDKIRLQKLLFLFTKRQQKAEYDFVPYKFGCYSYSANADLTTMVSKGMLAETTSHFTKVDKTDYLRSLKDLDRQFVNQVKVLYGKMDSYALMKYTYLNYPFYAINSLKASSILTAEELANVDKHRPKGTGTILFTIGYEGISLEEYLIRLLKNDVKVLVDVRSNPISMKYGFNKNQLNKFCDNLSITYMHFPEVGIQSDQRQELNSQADYDKLFTVYNKNLPKAYPTQLKILELLKQHKRIALTCFEANICQCHRSHLAKSIENLPDFDYEIKHI